MAQKTIVTLIDDLTGEEAEAISTVEFSLDGVMYEIDLADDNAAKLRDALATYVSAARKSGGRRSTRSKSRPSAGTSAGTGGRHGRETLKTIREWAKHAGHQVSDRGRLPADVLEAWEGRSKGNGGNTKAPSFSG